jgi:hypothetical protein
VAGLDDHQAVGFRNLGCNLRQVLGRGDADRDRKPDLVAHAAADLGRDLGGSAEEVHRPGDVEECFVDRDALDERREVPQHVDRGVAEPLVLAEVTADELQVGTEAACLPAGHPTVDSECLGLVRRGQDHAATDRDRCAAQTRIEELLDRRVEGIEVGVQDRRAALCHPMRVANICS